MSKIDKPSLLAFGCLVAMLCVQGEAKTNRKVVSQTRFIGRIDFDCVTSKYPKRRLAKLVRGAMKGLDAGDIGVWGNRAIAFDLNKDGKPEYFIPLDCGAVGNCEWGVFGLNPERRLGIIPAQGIYVQRSGDWPILVTYIHGSASEGLISVYTFAGNRYVKIRGDFEVSAYRKDFPKSMEKTQSTCEQSDASKLRRKTHRRRSKRA